MKKYGFVLMLFMVSSLTSLSQYGIIKGRVSSRDGAYLPAVHVFIKNSNLYAITDTAGTFEIKQIPAGTYDIACKGMGYKLFKKKVIVTQGAVTTLNIQLQDTITALKGVEVTAKSGVQEIKESPQAVTVIEAKQLYIQASGSADMINRASGVKVRQDGGLGSNADFSVNGMSGKQVRFFIDGIPTDYLGKGLGINVLPVNLIDHIEIYKGVVPIELGSDALGGAINVITRKNIGNYIDANYSAGSFNTHKAALNTRYLSDSSDFFIALNGFYNYSDNNYSVDVEIPDQFGTPHDTTVKRFHDAYRNYLVSAETGVIRKKWADLFSVSAGYSGMLDEIQHGVIMYQPFGKVTYQENTLNTALKFQKHHVLKNLDLNFYAGYNRISSLFTDTSRAVYAWDASVMAWRPTAGEISGSRNMLYFNTDNGIGRLNLNYSINATTNLNANVISTFYERKGHDTIAERYYGQDYFKRPTSMIKHVSGIALQKKFFSEKLTSVTSVKQYYYKAKGYEIDINNKQADTLRIQKQFGFSQAIRFQFNRNYMIRASYEYATRLPDEYEAFGDFALAKPNAGIQPETSHNINVGMVYKVNRFAFELNGFHRYTDNIIFLPPSRFVSQYRNLLRAEIRGVDGEISYKPFAFMALSANATFQDIRNKSSNENSGVVDNRYYNVRMPNIPYLFGNGEVRLMKKNIFKSPVTMQVWWNCSYVHEFYLYWAIDGAKDTKAMIPGQFVQNAGISGSFLNERFTICAEMFNLANTKTFDNYSVQKPGRMFSVKLRYFINMN